jgi:hypothetical protein
MPPKFSEKQQRQISRLSKGDEEAERIIRGAIFVYRGWTLEKSVDGRAFFGHMASKGEDAEKAYKNDDPLRLFRKEGIKGKDIVILNRLTFNNMRWTYEALAQGEAKTLVKEHKAYMKMVRKEGAAQSQARGKGL